MALGQLQAGLNVASGIAGLVGIGGKSKKKSRYELMAEKAAQTNLHDREIASSIASKYDPKAEDKLAFDDANRTATESVKQGLDQINTDFKNSGGSPTGDTAFNVNARDLVRRTFDPVRSQMYQQSATRSARQVALLGAASQAGGSSFSEYMSLANSQNTDPTGALASLQAGINGFTGKKKKPATNNEGGG
jgi:hypothetical protein